MFSWKNKKNIMRLSLLSGAIKGSLTLSMLCTKKSAVNLYYFSKKLGLDISYKFSSNLNEKSNPIL